MNNMIPPELIQLIKDISKDTRIKECIYPDHSRCSDKIVKSHSIQDSKILSKISENGVVLMGEPKNDFSHTFGHKEASTFTGFCGYHDKTVFQPIEDCIFNEAPKQIFLHVYRAFALVYFRRREAILKMKNLYADKRCLDKMLCRRVIDNLSLGIRNLNEDKKKFDASLLSDNYDTLTSIVWTFSGEVNFAANGIEALPFDFDGTYLQDIMNPTTPAKHIYISIFPENGKTFSIIAWFQTDDELFKNIKKKLNAISEGERINFLNNTIPISTENFAFKPSSIDKLSNQQKEDFNSLFQGEAEFYELEGKVLDRFQPRSYDLFTL